MKLLKFKTFNFDLKSSETGHFSIMKRSWDLAHEKLINIIGRHGILNENLETDDLSTMCNNCGCFHRIPMGGIPVGRSRSQLYGPVSVEF